MEKNIAIYSEEHHPDKTNRIRSISAEKVIPYQQEHYIYALKS